MTTRAEAERGAPISTPFFIIDTSIVRRRCRAFLKWFEELHFALKANPHEAIICTVAEEGGQFDAASWGEISLLFSLGVPASRIAFNAPAKIPREIELAHKAGIKVFTADCACEVEKLGKLAPGCDIMIRLAVNSHGSTQGLHFGSPASNVLCLAKQATGAGMRIVGLSFHVGTQNSRIRAWGEALEQCRLHWSEMEAAGIGSHLSIIDIGGGFPSQGCYHRDPQVPQLAEIAREVLDTRARLWDGHKNGLPRLWAEPGRSLVAESTAVVTSVISVADRGGPHMSLHIDAGIYNGLFESGAPWNARYPIGVLGGTPGRKMNKFVICGPTCDSADVVDSEAELPQDIAIGERLFVSNVGAYSFAMRAFNGFQQPEALSF